MPCNHRFQQDLYPEYRLKYLFIGTFNPEWNNPNGNNANWFYGRITNSFWNILPSVFGHPNLNNAYHRQNIQLWKEYCSQNSIGLTDIIQSIDDAEEEEHFNDIIGFQDNALENFKEIQFTKIEQLINQNKSTLCGVYLTRYCHTLPQNGIFSNRWNEIVEFCNQNKIYSSCLVTPSNGYMMPVIEKVAIWENQINNVCQHRANLI